MHFLATPLSALFDRFWLTATILLSLIGYLAVALPLTKRIWRLGRRRSGWLKHEALACLLPGFCLLLWEGLEAEEFIALSQDNPWAALWAYSLLPGLLGGLVLLPRLWLREGSPWRKARITFSSALLACALAWSLCVSPLLG